MEGVDIFASKGMEYIAVLVFLFCLILFWRWLNRPAAILKGSKVKNEKNIALIDWFHLAEHFYYHQGHSWVFPENNELVKVGIDDFTQKLLGKATKIGLPPVGDKIEQGEKGFQFQIDSKVIDVLAPIDGQIVAVNKEVIANPDLINSDPYNAGWLVKVHVPKLRAKLKNLMTARLAKVWMRETVDHLSTMMTKNMGIVLQDGGKITNGFVKEISANNWIDVVKEFLLTED